MDLGSCKVFIDQGKGAKDRYILFPASFRLVLKSHLQANPKNRYLFETSRSGPFNSSADPADRAELPDAGGAVALYLNRDRQKRGGQAAISAGTE